ncbi:hypothetical protein C8A00DRAFT_34599 [Chaetomidium leptoderma]|uniref:Uncharacterized protein n=1 Tax=Chaetomidium leptoderma TaxID=669021 RepID=A0AAN6VK14_9PEZI|nr:hypothetical protein C8A00DRAFT_34599 [Chaetomidium leptoderma]
MIAKEYIDGHGVKHPYLTVLLGIVFVAQWLLTVGYTGGQKAAGHDARGPAEPAKPCGVSKSPNPQGLSPPRATLWLTPYVTTRWRKAAALAVYLITLGLQLLEGYWMMELLGTATARWFRLWLGLVGVEAWFYAALMDFPLGPTPAADSACPVPIRATENRWRYDPWDPMTRFNIFRDSYERKPPKGQKPHHCVKSLRNWPELGDEHPVTLLHSSTKQARASLSTKAKSMQRMNG